LVYLMCGVHIWCMCIGSSTLYTSTKVLTGIYRDDDLAAMIEDALITMEGHLEISK
jgi:hypothetical protein